MHGSDDTARSPAGPRPSDAVLVAAARGGDRWAKQALFRRHAPMALGLARRLLAGDAELEDVVQDAYFRALTNLDKLKDPDAFRSWLAGIVVRRVQTRLRQRAFLQRIGLRSKQDCDPDLALSPSCPPDTATEFTRLYGSLHALSAQARVVLILRRVEGHSLVEIAELTGSSLSTVKRRLGDAERALGAQRRDEP